MSEVYAMATTVGSTAGRGVWSLCGVWRMPHGYASAWVCARLCLCDGYSCARHTAHTINWNRVPGKL